MFFSKTSEAYEKNFDLFVFKLEELNKLPGIVILSK